MPMVTFAEAQVALMQGKRVCRDGWNGKGMWLKRVPASGYELAPGLLDTLGDNPSTIELLPWIGMKTADNKFVPWLASQTDIQADDYWILD